MDVCLRGAIDGFQATREILERFVDVPVVLVSAVAADDAWREQARGAGAIAVLQKPLTVDAITAFLQPRNRKFSDPCSVSSLSKTELQAAVHRLDLPEARLLLESSKVSDQVDEENGNSLLHVAAKLGNVEMMQLLLDHGADPNAVSKKGYTPLHVAAWSGHVDCVELLLAQGCDPEIVCARRFRAVDLAAENIRVFQILSQASEGKQKSGKTKHRPARRRSLSDQTLPVLPPM